MTQEKFAGMRWVDGGVFAMGSAAFYPEEAPVRQVRVDGFWIDETPVTNAQFGEFVAATGHITVAEIIPDPKIYPGLTAESARAGSLVFHKPAGPVDMDDPGNWWRFVDGACWNRPFGPDSDLSGLDDHPVVHIAHADAAAYARWAGKTLPREAEFEFAARGGLDGCEFAWGDSLAPDGQMLANYWQGLFPFANQCLDGWEGTSPVRSFPPNFYGLYDMIGNVWEWTDDWWGVGGHPTKKSKCCTIDNPRGAARANSFDPAQPDVRIARKVIKGGSHLCAANYCQRYRPAARHPEMVDTSTTHIGFRCVVRGGGQSRR